ncbi:zinc-binding dehydrogenase [Granulicatella seriolae]|uniref:Zinc-binding dehydrogenase n=1 Tax=Granulicatella seriolae TaxID=2967226 RepID=A0ABT1WPW7_9LACT|nr:zinc-binding dehydrogenase [Granulicatella seriolae]
MIDYKTQDFRHLVSQVDVVIDTVGGATLANSIEVVKNGGRLISVAEVLTEELLEKANSKGISAEFITAQNNPEQLEHLADLVVNGELQVPIARKLQLNRENVAATHYQAKGKIVFIP